MIPSPWRCLARHPVWVRLALALLLAGTVRLAWDLVTHWDALEGAGPARFWSLLLLRCGGLAAGIWALASASRDRPVPEQRDDRSRPTGSLAAVAVILLGAIAIASLVELTSDAGDRFAARSAFRSVLLLGTSLWLSLDALSRRERASAPSGWRRWVGVAAVNLILALALLEGVSLAFAHAHPTRLLWNEQSARATIRANRLEPGARYLGFPANSGGYYDHEFHRAGPDDLVVAVLADSFGVGIVPHRHNFATVMERRLASRAAVAGRVAVHNYGVSGIGMPEYAWLLENEVPATSPTRIVLGLFVGNDISGLASRRERGFYSLQQFQLFELGRRLAAIGRARRSSGTAASEAPGPRRGRARKRGAGTFDEETYLAIERQTVELCNTRSRHMDRLYRASFDWLLRLHRQAGDRLLVVLIPDEYQVNDELYEALMRRMPDAAVYDRDHPQQRITGFCRQQSIEVLDLLGPLREANGGGSVYWLRDTHWNSRGNRIAGETIARYLLDGGRSGL